MQVMCARALRYLTATLLQGLCVLAISMAPVNLALASDHALLVGISNYPKIGKRLEGPANDLRLMQALMRGMGLPEANIEILADGLPERSALPTRANILSALDGLAQRAQPGEWAVVYFSGHGTQLPQTAATRSRYVEPDGMDSAFLPHDVEHWNPRRKMVVGAIVDDEIGIALRRIAAGGAKVWAIFDTCHAGDMTRGPGSGPAPAVSRFVAPGELGVPLARPAMALKATYGGGATSSRTLGVTVRLESAAGSTWVASYAAQRDEPALEESFVDPLHGIETRRYGVFTYHLFQLAHTKRLTFAELAQQVRDAYSDRPFPTPYFEGRLLTALPR